MQLVGRDEKNLKEFEDRDKTEAPAMQLVGRDEKNTGGHATLTGCTAENPQCSSSVGTRRTDAFREPARRRHLGPQCSSSVGTRRTPRTRYP